MDWPARLERAKETARLGGAILGVAATLGVLACLWRALHAAEDETLLALLGDGEADA